MLALGAHPSRERRSVRPRAVVLPPEGDIGLPQAGRTTRLVKRVVGVSTEARERYAELLAARARAHLGPRKPPLSDAAKRAVLGLVESGDIEIGRRWSSGRTFHLEHFEALQEDLISEHPADAEVIRSISFEEIGVRALA